MSMSKFDNLVSPELLNEVRRLADHHSPVVLMAAVSIVLEVRTVEGADHAYNARYLEAAEALDKAIGGYQVV